MAHYLLLFDLHDVAVEEVFVAAVAGCRNIPAGGMAMFGPQRGRRLGGIGRASGGESSLLAPLFCDLF